MAFDAVVYAILKKTKADLVNGKVPEEQLPSFVDEVIEVVNKAALPAIGDKSKIYLITVGTGVFGDRKGSCYRWGGTQYALISDMEFYTELQKKQNKLVAGYGIKLTDDATSQTTKIELGIHSIDLKGAVEYYANLPTTGQIEGDMWYVKKDDTDLAHTKGFYLWVENEGTKLWIKVDADTQWGKIQGDITKQLDLKVILDSKVDKESGKGLSTNDLTDELKARYDLAYTDHHKHTNKTVLDNTTAAFTLDQKNKIIEHTGKIATLESGLAAEKVERESGDDELRDLLVGEKNARIAKDEELEEKINTEITRAKGVESGLEGKIKTEEIRAKEEEAKKINLLGKEAGSGEEYHFPYNFDAKIESGKIKVGLDTITLDNNKTLKHYDKELTLPETGKVDDVKVNGTSVVTDKIANIDLTGKLDKNTTVTPKEQMYVKHADGTQGMADIPEGAAIDTEMSDTSVNAVQNKVIKKYVDDENKKQINLLGKESGSGEDYHFPFNFGAKFEDGKIKVGIDTITLDNKKTIKHYDAEVAIPTGDGKVKDVTVDGTSVLSESGVAKIDLTSKAKQADLEAEILVRESGDKKLESGIKAEEKRAKEAESGLEEDIEAELVRAVAAEATKINLLGDESGSKAPYNFPFHISNLRYDAADKKLKATLHTITLDNYKTIKTFPLEVEIPDGKVKDVKVNDLTIVDSEGNALIKLVNNATTDESGSFTTAHVVYNLSKRITNLEARGRFLSSIDCANKLVTTLPEELPYAYKSGDWFTVIADGNNKPKDGVTSIPAGATNIEWETSSTYSRKGDLWRFDGSKWIHESQSATTFESILGEPRDNTKLKTELGTLESGINKKIDLLGKEAGSGEEYHFPYNFDAKIESGKIKVGLDTITLDNKKTLKHYDKELALPEMGKVDDVKVDGVSVVTDKVANINLTGKQNKLIAGKNIKLLESGDKTVISALGGGEPETYVKKATVSNHTIKFINESGIESIYNRDIIYSALEPENPVEDMIWLESGDESGSIGEPEEYIKKAEVDGNKLTLTKKDNSTVEFAPDAGKNWITLDFNSEDLKAINDGQQLVRTVNEYAPTNFKNDYFKAILNTAGDVVGTMLQPKDNFNHLYLDIKDYTTEEGARKEKNPGWNTADIQETLMTAIKGGFDFHYYKTAILWAGCSESGKPILEGENVLETKDVVYIQDVSQQKWEINAEEKPGTSGKREGLEQEIYGGAYVISVNIGTKPATNEAVLICYKESQAAYWDPSTGTIRWANILAGKSYPVEFDTEYESERWLLGGGVEDDPREGHEGEKIAIELVDAKKEAYLTTGFTFESGLQAAETVIDEAIKLKTPCLGVYSKEATKIFSWNNPFEAMGEALKYEFIGRPAGYYLTTYTWKDESGATQVNTDGEYVWEIKVQGNDITVVIPASALDKMIIEKSSQSAVGSEQQEYSTTSLYRHTFTILNDPDATIEDDEYKLYCSFCGVNAQAGENSINYIMFSDLNYQDADWILPANGKIGKVSGGTVSTWFDIIRIKAGYDGDKNRCLNIEYWDTDINTVVTAQAITVNNMKKYIGRDFRSEIGSIIANNTATKAAAEEK